MIYFVRMAEMNAVKIGRTAGNSATERVAALRVACPGTLELLATMPGDLATERELHERFAVLRIRGEWFRYEGELVAVVNGVRDSGGKPDGYGDRCWRLAEPGSAEHLLAPVCETAYRRGFQHAVGALTELLVNTPAERVAAVLIRAGEAACDMRFDGKAHPRYWPEFQQQASGD